MLATAKRKVHVALDPNTHGNRLNKIVNGSLITLIILNTVAVMFETMHDLYQPYRDFFHAFDLFSVTIFAIEYILRVWSCTEDPRYQGRISGRIKYMFSLPALIDLFAILPFFLHAFFLADLRFIRVLRLLRLLRILKLGRYLKASDIVNNVVREHKEELVLSFLLAIFLILASSSLIYFVEHPVQPEVFTSIPASMWWSVTTLTTVGYGDMIPITPVGKILAGVISLISIGLFALPAGIIASGLAEEIRKRKKVKRHCPYCNHELDDSMFHHH
jgi:voltage-gated potassium channel